MSEHAANPFDLQKDRTSPDLLPACARGMYVLISEIRVVPSERACELQARVKTDAARRSFLLRFCFPPALTTFLIPQNGDPFLAAFLLPAMKAHETLEIPAAVSPRLLRSVGEIQRVYRRWDSTLSEVRVKAPVREVHSSPPAEVLSRGLFFSCGVDSFYSLLKHAGEHREDHGTITHLILVRGFDTHFGKRNARVFDNLRANAERVAQAMGMELLPLATNVREFSDRFVDWGLLYNGAAMASVGLALGSMFERIYVAATHYETELLPWGSSPLLDPLWSTESLSFLHDGCEARRVEKIHSIARFPIVLETLRVCMTHSYSDNVYNCGSCGKCFRTMIGLHLAGALGKCRTFPETIDVRLLRNVYTPRRTFVGCSDTDSAIRSALKESVSGDALSTGRRRLFTLITDFLFVYAPTLAPIWNALQRVLSISRNQARRERAEGGRHRVLPRAAGQESSTVGIAESRRVRESCLNQDCRRLGRLRIYASKSSTSSPA